MTPAELRAENVLRSCYMGEMPTDPWVMLLKTLIAAEIQRTTLSTYQDAADRICDSCSRAIVARRDEVCK